MKPTISPIIPSSCRNCEFCSVVCLSPVSEIGYCHLHSYLVPLDSNICSARNSKDHNALISLLRYSRLLLSCVSNPTKQMKELKP